MDLSALKDRILPAVSNRSTVQATRVFKVESMDLTFSNGNRATYERILGGKGAVMAVPFDGEHFFLTAEYCGGVMQYQLGLVKGKIDNDETPAQAVVRELSEEIGVTCNKVTLLKNEMTVAPGFMELKMYAYLCEDLSECGASGGDEPEPVAVVKLTPAEVLELMFDPASPLTEGRTIAALSLALHHLGLLQATP